MSTGLRLGRTADTAALWTLAAAIVIFGGWLIQGKYEEAIADSRARTETIYARAVANERTVAEAPSLKKIQSIAERDLRTVARDVPLSLTTAQLLVLLQRSATHYNVSVIGVEPGQTPAGLETTTPAAGRLSRNDLTIRLQGHFGDILQFVENLSRQSTLIAVGNMQLALAQNTGDAGEPVLDATIQATLYRLTLPSDEERHTEQPR